MKTERFVVFCSTIALSFCAIWGCDSSNQQSTIRVISSKDVERLGELVANPPADMSVEEVANEIASFFPRMKRNKSMTKYEETHEHASIALPQAVEMEKHFESIDHFITHFGMNISETNIWNSEAFFGDRYEFTMQIEIKIDYASRTFVVVGEPTFYLTEGIKVDRDGGCRSGESFAFGTSKFKKLLDANWDFSAIGIKINPKPVANYKIYEAMTRSPRYPISLVK